MALRVWLDPPDWEEGVHMEQIAANDSCEHKDLWSRWRRFAAPSLFFLAVLYYEELFLKLYCFHNKTSGTLASEG